MSQYIFIDTSKCEGTPSRFSFTVPQNLIKCESDERMRLSLIKWTCRHDWYVVRSPNNVFSIQLTGSPLNFTIPEGNYKYEDYASTIQTLLNSQKVALGELTTNTITCEYLSAQCHLKFTFKTAATRTFRFPSDFLSNYGMSLPTYTITNTILESDVPIDFYKNRERLYIYCHGIHPRSNHRNLQHSVDTVAEMNNSRNLLASVLVNAYPFETIVYEDDGSIYGHHLQDNHLFGRLDFQIKTITGLDADFLNESHLVLKIDKIPNEKLLRDSEGKVQTEIRDYLRLMFLSQNMGSDLPNQAIQLPA